jgi:hypothetical protein
MVLSVITFHERNRAEDNNLYVTRASVEIAVDYSDSISKTSRG